jgi:hypothetical protein
MPPILPVRPEQRRHEHWRPSGVLGGNRGCRSVTLTTLLTPSGRAGAVRRSSGRTLSLSRTADYYCRHFPSAT